MSVDGLSVSSPLLLPGINSISDVGSHIPCLLLQNNTPVPYQSQKQPPRPPTMDMHNFPQPNQCAQQRNHSDVIAPPWRRALSQSCIKQHNNSVPFEPSPCSHQNPSPSSPHPTRFFMALIKSTFVNEASEYGSV